MNQTEVGTTKSPDLLFAEPVNFTEGKKSVHSTS